MRRGVRVLWLMLFGRGASCQRGNADLKLELALRLAGSNRGELEYEDVPEGALCWLHDRSAGVEEWFFASEEAGVGRLGWYVFECQ